jgi:hypothetical protein
MLIFDINTDKSTYSEFCVLLNVLLSFCSRTVMLTTTAPISQDRSPAATKPVATKWTPAQARSVLNCGNHQRNLMQSTVPINKHMLSF